MAFSTWASMIYRQLGCAQNRKNRSGGEFPSCSHEDVQQGKWRGGDTAVAGRFIATGSLGRDAVHNENGIGGE